MLPPLPIHFVTPSRDWCSLSALILAGSVAFASCGAEDPISNRSGVAGEEIGDNPIVAPAECSELNLTQSCTCAKAAGRQVCDGARWGACECAPPAGAAGAAGAGSAPNLEGNARSDITFVWERTPSSGDLGGCLPGYYEGTFGGIYWSFIATLAPIPELAVPIANIELPDAPSGFHFTVEPATGGETVLKIKGEMIGTADLTFPFSAALEGELDCRDKTFHAKMLNGKYSVLVDGLVAQDFTGDMTGRYDVRTHTLVDGAWDVWETSGNPPGRPAPMLPRDFKRDGFGGYGTWSAALPTDLSATTLATCPTNFSCGKSQLGPNKLLCNSLLGPPGCASDAECDTQFAGVKGVSCLKASAFSTCLLECRP